jgi:hypothetical protein
MYGTMERRAWRMKLLCKYEQPSEGSFATYKKVIATSADRMIKGVHSNQCSDDARCLFA